MPEAIVTRILRLPGYGVSAWEADDATGTLTLWVHQTGGEPAYICGGCGIARREVHSWRERRVRDLPWGTWQVWLGVDVHRLRCRGCGVRTERIPWLAGTARYTARLEAAVAQECEQAPVSRVAARWRLPPETVRQLDKRALRRWAASRPRKPLHYLGVDEFFVGKGSSSSPWSATWCRESRSGWVASASVKRWTGSSPRRCRPRAAGPSRPCAWTCGSPSGSACKSTCPACGSSTTSSTSSGMPVRPWTKPGGLSSSARGARGLVRGKRWLLLRSWTHLDRQDRQSLRELVALNRRLAKAYLLKEQLTQLWSYTYEGAARRFLATWLRALRWQRLPAFQKLARLLTRHLEGILNYCHEKVPFGKVEAINGNIRAMLRRGRGYRDHEYLLLKVQRATATRRRQAA